jgi:hypothetical protein
MGTVEEQIGSTSYFPDVNPTVVESSTHFKPTNSIIDHDPSRVFQEELVQPSSSSRQYGFVTYSEVNELIRQPEKSPVPHSTSSNDFMEVIESNVEQFGAVSEEEGPCSDLDALNPSPVDNENGESRAYFLVVDIIKPLKCKFFKNR